MSTIDGPTDISRQDARAALTRMKTRRPFSASPKLTRLLEYLVESAFAGDESAFSAYAIGTECLGLSPDFNPSVNSHVRVAVGRLRSALQKYHMTEGATDDIHMSIPTGSARIALEKRARDIDQSGATEPDPLHDMGQLGRIAGFTRPDPRLRDGYYECCFPSYTVPGAIMAHLMHIRAGQNRHVWKSLCRVPNPASSSSCLSPIKFMGDIYCVNGRLFSIYSEHPNPSMIAFFSLEPHARQFTGTSRGHGLLVGVNVAPTADMSHHPLAAKMSLTYIGKSPDLRHEVTRTGFYDKTSDRFSLVVKKALSEPGYMRASVGDGLDQWLRP